MRNWNWRRAPRGPPFPIAHVARARRKIRMARETTFHAFPKNMLNKNPSEVVILWSVLLYHSPEDLEWLGDVCLRKKLAVLRYLFNKAVSQNPNRLNGVKVNVEETIVPAATRVSS